MVDDMRHHHPCLVVVRSALVAEQWDVLFQAMVQALARFPVVVPVAVQLDAPARQVKWRQVESQWDGPAQTVAVRLGGPVWVVAQDLWRQVESQSGAPVWVVAEQLGGPVHLAKLHPVE